MKISEYKELIQRLPFLKQSFDIDSEN